MKQTYLTRHDNVGCEPYDSIAWSFEVHVKHMPDKGIYNGALLYGNEDAPDKIEFWLEENPHHEAKPDFVWTNTDSKI
jgi:hypothetical protein